MNQTISTKNLKRTLGRKELFPIAIGQIIGAGVMALTGVAISMTGRSVSLAYILAGIAVLFIAVHVVFASSVVRFRGGNYTQTATFVGQKFAGIYIIFFIVSNVSLAIYAISFADYLLALIPGLPSKLIAGILMSVVFAVNFFGIKKAIKLQKTMVIILLGAILLFIGFGVFKIEPGYFSQPGFLTNGLGGLLLAMALLTFAASGGSMIVNLSAEAKNPKKDLPMVMIVSTLVVSVLYALMAVVASGVLPIENVANQPLTLVANIILPDWLYVVFIVGGAMFALVTTLNGQLAFVTKPIMQACVDNWFPRSLAKLHPKYNTPYKLLIGFYIIGMVPILVNIDIEMIASFALLVVFIATIMKAVGVFRLPKLFEKQWLQSPFYMKNFWFYLLNGIGILVLLVQVFLLASNLNTIGLVGNLVVLVGAIAFGLIRNKKVKMEISIEEN